MAEQRRITPSRSCESAGMLSVGEQSKARTQNAAAEDEEIHAP